MMRASSTFRATFLAAASAALLTGCLLGPDYRRPELPTPATFDNQFELQQTGEEFWWRGFKDPALNGLVETALKRNISIEVAIRQFEGLNAGVRAAQSDLFPTIDAQVNRNQNFTSDDAQGQLDNNGNPFIRSRGVAQLVFTPDFFGRSRRAVQRAREPEPAGLRHSGPAQANGGERRGTLCRSPSIARASVASGGIPRASVADAGDRPCPPQCRPRRGTGCQPRAG